MIDTARSEKRREASRTIACFLEGSGLEWSSLREGVIYVAGLFKIECANKRRTQIAFECVDKISGAGFKVPTGYVAPWLRGGAPPRFTPAPRKPTNDNLWFYDSIEWRRFRYDILKDRGRICECCGATNKTAVIMVDHIKPLRDYWELRFAPDNMQVLCEDCNRGKGRRDKTDWRD